MTPERILVIIILACIAAVLLVFACGELDEADRDVDAAAPAVRGLS